MTTLVVQQSDVYNPIFYFRRNALNISKRRCNLSGFQARVSIEEIHGARGLLLMLF